MENHSTILEVQRSLAAFSTNVWNVWGKLCQWAMVTVVKICWVFLLVYNRSMLILGHGVTVIGNGCLTKDKI